MCISLPVGYIMDSGGTIHYVGPQFDTEKYTFLYPTQIEIRCPYCGKILKPHKCEDKDE